MARTFRATLLPAGFEASALNDSSLIVGTRDKRAVVWNGRRFTALAGKILNKVGHSRDEARGLSSSGIVVGCVGWVFSGAALYTPSEAALWRKNRRTLAPTVKGYSGAGFSGVNARSEAVGYAATAGMQESNALDSPDAWSHLGETTSPKSKALYWDGAALHEEGWGALHAINDSGAMVGEREGNAVYRPSPKAPWVVLCRGEARTISPNGTVCGNRNVGDSKALLSETRSPGMPTVRTFYPLYRGFLWRSGKRIDLLPLPSFDESRALGVHDAGGAVGTCTLTGSSRQSRATLWRGGKPTALDSLVSLRAWRLTEARAITSQGRILCVAQDARENRRSVVLDPID